MARRIRLSRWHWRGRESGTTSVLLSCRNAGSGSQERLVFRLCKFPCSIHYHRYTTPTAVTPIGCVLRSTHCDKKCSNPNLPTSSTRISIREFWCFFPTLGGGPNGRKTHHNKTTHNRISWSFHEVSLCTTVSSSTYQ
jgi:hypothetical protein